MQTQTIAYVTKKAGDKLMMPYTVYVSVFS